MRWRITQVQYTESTSGAIKMMKHWTLTDGRKEKRVEAGNIDWNKLKEKITSGITFPQKSIIVIALLNICNALLTYFLIFVGVLTYFWHLIRQYPYSLVSLSETFACRVWLSLPFFLQPFRQKNYPAIQPKVGIITIGMWYKALWSPNLT